MIYRLHHRLSKLKLINRIIFISAATRNLRTSPLGSPYDNELEGLSVLSDSETVINENTGAGLQVSSGAYMTNPKSDADAFFAKLTFHSTFTGINETKEAHPGGFKLDHDYPNPFNPSSTCYE
jgi:hypothetical protein